MMMKSKMEVVGRGRGEKDDGGGRGSADAHRREHGVVLGGERVGRPSEERRRSCGQHPGGGGAASGAAVHQSGVESPELLRLRHRRLDVLSVDPVGLGRWGGHGGKWRPPTGSVSRSKAQIPAPGSYPAARSRGEAEGGSDSGIPRRV